MPLFPLITFAARRVSFELGYPKYRMKNKLSRRRSGAGGVGAARITRGAGHRGTSLPQRSVERVDTATSMIRTRFNEALNWAVDSGVWLLIVVGLFILLPVGVMYLVSQGVKDEPVVRQERVEADILAPVNIFSERLDGR